MEQYAARLAEYTKDRIGEGVRAVGYHTEDVFDVEYIRDDLREQYPENRVQRFIRTSRRLHSDLQFLDDAMGVPEASLHVLEEGLIIQFHFPDEDVVFLSMDKDVGRNFTRFIHDCVDHMT